MIFHSARYRLLFFLYSSFYIDVEYRQSLARGLSIADMNGGFRCMVTRRQTRNQLPPICLNFEIEGAWLNFFKIDLYRYNPDYF